MMTQAAKHGERVASADETGGDRNKHMERVNKMGKVAVEHDPRQSTLTREINSRRGQRKRDAGRPRRNELQDNW